MKEGTITSANKRARYEAPRNDYELIKSAILNVCNAQDDTSLSIALIRFRGEIKGLDIFKKDGKTTCLEIALNLPYKKNSDKLPFANGMATSLFNILLEEMLKTGNHQKITEILAEPVFCHPKYKTYILQVAIPKLTDCSILLNLLKQYPAALAANLQSRNDKGHLPFQTAIMKGSEKCLSELFSALECNREILLLNLNNEDKVAMMPLQTAILKGFERNIKQVLEILIAVNDRPTLVKNLLNADKKGLKPLMAFINRRIKGELSALLSTLKLDLPSFRANFENVNEFGEMPLQVAFTYKVAKDKQGNDLNLPEALLQELATDHEMLKINLNNCATNGLYPLQRAFVNGDFERTAPLIQCLKESVGKFPEVIRNNLLNRKENLLPLQVALSKGVAFKNIPPLLDLLEQDQDALKENLEDANASGLLPLGAVIVRNPFTRVVEVLDVLVKYPDLLRKNMENTDVNQHNIFEIAIIADRHDFLNNLLSSYTQHLDKNQVLTMLNQSCLNTCLLKKDLTYVEWFLQMLHFSAGEAAQGHLDELLANPNTQVILAESELSIQSRLNSTTATFTFTKTEPEIITDIAISENILQVNIKQTICCGNLLTQSDVEKRQLVMNSLRLVLNHLATEANGSPEDSINYVPKQNSILIRYENQHDYQEQKAAESTNPTVSEFLRSLPNVKN